MSAAELGTMRKRPSPSDAHIFRGAFTRRKSEVFLHRTRSGRCRPDPYPHPKRQLVDLAGFRLLTKKPRANASTQDQEVSAGVIFSPFLVKDLRARRIISASVNEENNGVSCKATVLEETDSLIRDCLEDVKKLVGGFSLEMQPTVGGKTRSHLKEEGFAGGCLAGGQVLEDKSVEKLKGGLPSKELEALGEDSEFPHSTPPDAEICAATLEAEKNREAQMESGSLRDKIPGKPSTREFPRNNRRRSALNPCSRVKLFKASNSISYRRMLPYLMDIVKEQSDASKKGQSHKSEESLDQSSTGEKLLEESKRDSRLTTDHKGEVSGNSPVVDEPCSRLNADGDASKFEDDMSFEGLVIGRSCQDPSLIMKDYPFNKGNPAGVRCDETKLTIGAKTEITDTLGSNVQDSKCSLQSQECHPCDDGIARKCSDETHLFGTEEVWSSVQHSLDAQHLHHMKPSSSDKEGSCTWDLKEKGENDVKVSDQVVDIIEGCVKVKRPNADSICESKEEASGGSPSDSHIDGVNPVIINSSSGNSQENNACSAGDRLNSCMKGKQPGQVLQSGRRKKLFKIPGSLNYRRMLHVLTGSSGDGQFEEIKMSIKGKPPSPLGCHTGFSNIIRVSPEIIDQGPSNMSDNDKPQPSGCGTDSSNTVPLCLETIDQGPSQMSDIDKPPSPIGPHAYSSNVIPVGLETIDKGSSECNKELASFPDHIASFQRELDSKQGQEQPPEPILPRGPVTTDSSNGGQPPATSLSSSTINSELVLLPDSTREDEVQLSISAKPTEAHPCLTKAVPSDTEVADVFLRKGILKQNPRGCRGLCTCLKCSSFRLHAERAFDFSRNQMQDAEEVALDLMKELAYLRAMLQKSSVGADVKAVLCLNQVKEACRKCSEAEEIAKDRLSQMNNELNIHCRFPYEHGARVRFANDVERAIPSTNLQNRE